MVSLPWLPRKTQNLVFELPQGVTRIPNGLSAASASAAVRLRVVMALGLGCGSRPLSLNHTPYAAMRNPARCHAA